jgi:hypothetical protein
MAASKAETEDEPPDSDKKPRILRWEDTTPRLLSEICHFKSNGNWRDVLDFFARISAFKGKEVRVKAKRDGGEPYATFGYLTPGLSYENPDDELPASIILTQQNQTKDFYIPIPIDRITSIRTVGTHA